MLLARAMAELGPVTKEKASLEKTALMSIIVLLCLLFGVAAILLLVLFFLQRRQLNALELISQQVQRVAPGDAHHSRIELHTDQPELAGMVAAVNRMIGRFAAQADKSARATAPIGSLGDRVHEAVLIQGETIRYANPQFANLLGCSAQELIGQRLQDLVPPDHKELVGDNMRRRLAGEPAAERYEVDLVGRTGQSARLELSSWLVEFEGERALLIVGVEVLPTQTLQALQDAGGRSRSRRALESLSEALITTDVDGRVDYINPAAARLMGVVAEEATGATLEELAANAEEGDRKLLAEPIRQALAAGTPLNLGRRALMIRPPGGAEHMIELSAAPIHMETGETIGAVVLLHDVTEMRGMARQMSYQATHDALTGLVNRREFERRLQEAVDTAHRGDATHVLCYLDLDRFKAINDTSGHIAGDAMLRESAKILRDAVRDSDTVARVGGDEFGMLLVGCPLEKARQIADDVCRAVGDYRFIWKDKLFNIGVSVGLVEISRESGTMEEVLAAADAACYVAKKEGAGRVAVYSARDEARARHTGEIQWLQRLQSALKENRFHLYHQPIVPAYGVDRS